ncbi:MAG TPA: multicopper oxidase family protein, partial [Longimicrobium sp.]|nr:multicopper oxidase family protein [Longimicrobium sp.]
GDSTYTRNVYNGQYVAPVLRMKREERLDVMVSNQMKPVGTQQPQSQVDTTNQHYHGMIVTPLPDTGDNVTNVPIGQGRSNRNAFYVPDVQSEGMMWYHPHPHGRTANQVAGGLAGALIIGEILDSFPDFAGAGGEHERVMYIKDTRDNTSTAYLNINGVPCTGFTIAPGEQQLWRIANMTGATWVNLRLGERGRGYRFIVLALDGNHLTRPTPMDSLFLAPGQRAEAVIIGGTGPWGKVAFYSSPFPTSFNRSNPTQVNLSARVDLGTLEVIGGVQPKAVPPRALSPLTIPENVALLDSITRLRTATDVDTFTIHYQFFPGRKPFPFALNDSSYVPGRLDHAVAYGRTQEWTLINDTWFNHTFHIHQTDFVVTEINGVPQPDSVHLDNVHLGIHQRPDGRWAGDTVKVRFRFLPIARGPFVYHCHDLAHEDLGMMANMCVFNPATGESECDQWFDGGHGGHASMHGGHGAPGGHASVPAPPPAAPATGRKRE